MAKRTPGLQKRANGIWYIDKKIPGYGRLCRSCQTKDREEAEARLAYEVERIRRAVVYGERMSHTFEEAAARWVDEAGHKTLQDDIKILTAVMPYIGHMDVSDIHDGTLAPYIADMKGRGCKSGTAARHIAVIRNVLTKCARKWRDESGQPWLNTIPLLEIPDWGDKRKPYPLSYAEQKALLQELPPWMAQAALYAVNTGIRSNTQAQLRWEWEHEVDEIGARVFVVPGEFMKGRGGKTDDFVIVHNRIAASVIESCRGRHPEFVFTTHAGPFSQMATTSFKKARARIGLEQFRWHDWRHTFARRLRAHRVPAETRKVLLGHKSGDITTHYSAAELQELIAAVSKIENRTTGTLLRAVRSQK